MGPWAQPMGPWVWALALYALAGGAPHAARLGLGPGMGAGQRVPSVAEEGGRPELELRLTDRRAGTGTNGEAMGTET